MKTLFKNKFVNLKSPIFWRITAGVFASILFIELILLVYSWSTERNRLLTRLDESITTLTSLLDRENPVPQLDHLPSAASQALFASTDELAANALQKQKNFQDMIFNMFST